MNTGDAVIREERETRPKTDLLTPGRRRVVIEQMTPQVDCGRFPIKRTAGETVVVEADVFADGHDMLSAVLLYRREDADGWMETDMAQLANDRWRGAFTVPEAGRYAYTVRAWVDPFKTWARDLGRRVEAGQEVSVDLQIGADLVQAAAERAASAADPADADETQDPRVSRDAGSDAAALRAAATRIRQGGPDGIAQARSPHLAALMHRYAERGHASTHRPDLWVVVDRERARFGAWYELFPRSCAPEPGRYGTLRDCAARLSYIASMGFDVVYLPPIHPIGRVHRKGRNNNPAGGSEDPGSPWGIGAEEGGHKAIHPALGTLDDFRQLVSSTREHGMEIALDLAYQCAPDHPYVREHPEWFRRRPDGRVQYAENPPKKYEDIYPFDFETERWQELWRELKSVVDFWVEQGVRIFRVDNPHTKPFAFWEWLIAEVKREHPDVLFLSEAFTRPKVMYRLAKLGFTQSYTYFAWRNTKWELTQYLTEITRPPISDFFRPNLWPNTPDILTEYLQTGGRPAFAARLVLAATLGASYGIYGPAFELCERMPREPGSEEYLDSEKYEVRHWDLERPDSLRPLITLVNRIRREHPALQSDRNLLFHPTDNEYLIAYSKHTDDLSSVVLVVVNLDPHHTQFGWVDVQLEPLSLDAQEPYQVHDLLGDARYLWHGSRNYVELRPDALPAHVFLVRRRVRRERDFEYYL